MYDGPENMLLQKKIMLPSVLQGIRLRKDYHVRWLNKIKEDDKKGEEDEKNLLTKVSQKRDDQSLFCRGYDFESLLSCDYPKRRKTALLAELDRDRNYLKELLTNESKPQ